jgi:agmatinase
MASVKEETTYDFLSLEEEAASLEAARFVVLPVPYETTTSYRKGTKNGPAALMEASAQVELYDEELRRETWKMGVHTLPPMASDEPAEVFFPRLEAKVAEIAKLEDKTLFTIGGEHSLTQALIPPFAKVHKGLSVLHFDAHADLRAEYHGTPHSHACALYPASRQVPVVQVGIRSVGPEELPHTDSGNVKTFYMHENLDTQQLIRKVLGTLSDTVYITIDLDGFDPSVVPGVGTPQPGGFSWHEGLALFRAVCESKKVVAVDVMELRPLPEEPSSEMAAAKLVYRLMGYLSAPPMKRRPSRIGFIA